MADKPRTPKPPRPVQAPKRRDSSSSGGGSGLSAVPQWVWIVGVVLVAGIAAGAFLVTRGGSDSAASSANVKAAMVAAGCTYRDVKPLPPKNKTNYHADSPTLTSKVKWSTFPPSGGGHYGRWAIWDFYTSPVNPREVVHNLEHGAVVIWWGPKVPKSVVDKLSAFYYTSPDAIVGTPIAGLGDKIALTAWTGDPSRYYRNGYYGIGHIAICPKFDEAAFATFRDAYRNKGPEGIPPAANKPGQGP